MDPAAAPSQLARGFMHHLFTQQRKGAGPAAGDERRLSLTVKHTRGKWRRPEPRGLDRRSSELAARAAGRCMRSTTRMDAARRRRSRRPPAASIVLWFLPRAWLCEWSLVY
jgi:hypothetical protein